MPERTLTYIYESEDRSSQALRSMAGSAAGADDAFESLENQILSYDQKTRSVAAGAINFENALEALNAEGIVTTQQIQNQIAQYDRLLQYYERDALATQQLTTLKAGLKTQLAAAERGQNAFGQASGNTAAFVNNFAFTLNDAQQASLGLDALIRATSNNIGVMISQFQAVSAAEQGFRGAMRSIGRSLIGPLGISVAFNAATTAIVLLQDAFKDAGDAAEDSAEEIQRPFEGLIEIIDAVKGSFDVNFTTLRQQSLTIAGEIGRIRNEIIEQERVVSQAFEQLTQAPNNRERISVLESERASLTALQEQLETQQGIQEEIALSLEKESEFRSRINELEQAGFKFSQDKNEEDEKSTRNALDELLALEELTKERDTLLLVTSEINREDLRRSAILESEIAQLEGIIEVRKRLFIEEARQREILQQFGADATPARLEGLGLEPQDIIPDSTAAGVLDILKNIQERFQSDGTANVEFVFDIKDEGRLKARGLSDSIVSEVDAISKALEDELFEDVEDLIDLNERLSDSIQTSLAGGIAAFGAGLGDVISGAQKFSSLGGVVLGTLADLGQSVGQQLIAFGTAGIAIQAFVTNPFAAIAAGLGLIALARTLRNRVQSQVNATTGAGGGQFGAGGAAPGTAGFTRTGLDGRLEAVPFDGRNRNENQNSNGLLVPRSGNVQQGADASGPATRRQEINVTVEPIIDLGSLEIPAPIVELGPVEVPAPIVDLSTLTIPGSSFDLSTLEIPAPVVNISSPEPAPVQLLQPLEPLQTTQRVEITLSEDSVVNLPGGAIKLSLQLTNQRDAELGISDNLGV